MKKTLLFLSFVLSVGYVQATIHTVSNMPGNPAQFEKIQDAVDAAAAGDTIYIAGSGTTYEGFELNKRLVFMGSGYNPQKEDPLVSRLSTIQIGNKLSHASNSEFIGLYIGSISCGQYGCHGIKVRRSLLGGVSASGMTNWVIEESVTIGMLSFGGTQNNCVLSNNIILSYVGIDHSVLTNNVFFKQGAYISGRYNTILNNIFFRVSKDHHNNVNFNTFNNNITYLSEGFTLPFGNNSGIDNLNDTDPLFENWDEENSVHGHFEYGVGIEKHFTLKSNSPAKNAGTDGTDIGNYGRKGFSETGEPAIPVVMSFLIKNGVIEPDGKLNVIIESETRN